MNKFLLCTISCCLSSIAVVAQRDSIYLYEQIPLAGEFKSIKKGVINFDADGIGDIAIKKYKVRTLKAFSDLVRIETIGRKLYYGKILPSPDDGKVMILAVRTIEIDLDSISEMTYYREKFSDRLSGNVSLGFNYSKSSAIGKLNFDDRTTYSARDYDLLLKGSAGISITPDSTVREAENLALQGSRNIFTSWLIFGLLNYQRNFELGILRRYQEGIGIGNKVLLKPRLTAVILTGIVFNEEKSVAKTEKTVLAEIPAIVQVNFFSYGRHTIECNISQSTYFSLSQKGRIRNDGQVNFSWEITKDFWLTSIFYNNSDSRPPNASDTKFDYSIVFGIKYKF